jgi:hypothetical protein
MNRFAITLTLLAAGLGAPLMVKADGPPQRYYDKQHKDYHEWNANEEKSYSVYLGEKHITVHTFQKAKPKEQQDYWNWRHQHPDEKR